MGRADSHVEGAYINERFGSEPVAEEAGRGVGEPYTNAKQAIRALDRDSHLRGRCRTAIRSEMQLVRFIDQGLGGWQCREGNGMGFDQPHYRLRQTKTGNIGVEEDGWQVGFRDAGGDPLDRENKLGGITGRSGKLERFLGRLDGHRRNVGRQLQINWSFLDPAASKDSIDFP